MALGQTAGLAIARTGLRMMSLPREIELEEIAALQLENHSIDTSAAHTPSGAVGGVISLRIVAVSMDSTQR